MMRVLTTEQAREADRHAIEDVGIPSAVLMENAGAEVVRALEDALGDLEDTSVLILCGKGNNGGDGMVVARRLAARGALARVVLLGDPDDLSGDAALQWSILRNLGLPAHPCGPPEWHDVRDELEEVDLVIDAILGTGFKGRLEGFLAEVVEDVNASSAPVLAIDVPSGLSGTTSDVNGPCVDASLTVTFAAPKLCHVLPPAQASCGDVAVCDIGIPETSMALAGARLAVLDDEVVGEVVAELADREEDTHKGTWGHVVVVAGATGRTGAAALAARAALAAGAGLVTVATPEPCVGSVAAHAMELMQLALPATPDGEVGAATRHVEEILERADALVIGPGLGTGPGAAELLAALLAEARVPTLLDADALNLLAAAGEWPEELEDRPLVLTPHPGELARLLHGIEGDEASSRLSAHGRLERAMRIADEVGHVVVVKGFRTIVAAPHEDALINPTGNPGLGTAGAGDVLSGLVGGLLAAGVPPFAAAAAGVYLHGRAADLAADLVGEMALTAGDVLRCWPAAVRSVTSDEEDSQHGHDHDG